MVNGKHDALIVICFCTKSLIENQQCLCQNKKCAEGASCDLYALVSFFILCVEVMNLETN